MRKLLVALIFAAAAICAPFAANAQHTTCMAMGPDMVSCDTIGGNTYQPNNDGGAALGRGLGDLIAGINEKNLRKRVGKLLADGDCEGAARLALEKGRLEMGLAIPEGCGPSPAQQRSAEVSRQLKVLAAQAKTPTSYGEDLTITAVQAVDLQLWLTVQYAGNDSVPIEHRNAAVNEICASEVMQPLLLEGATVTAFYLAPNGGQVAKDQVTAGVCGLS